MGCSAGKWLNGLPFWATRLPEQGWPWVTDNDQQKAAELCDYELVPLLLRASVSSSEERDH